MDNREFYMVWNPQTGYTMHRHYLETDARKEAERLAKQQPGDQFYVLKAVCVKKVETPVQSLELKPGLSF